MNKVSESKELPGWLQPRQTPKPTSQALLAAAAATSADLGRLLMCSEQPAVSSVSASETESAEVSEVEVRPAAVADATPNALWTERFRPTKATEVRTLDLVSGQRTYLPCIHRSQMQAKQVNSAFCLSN